MPDTTKEAQAVLTTIRRRIDAAERVRQISDLSEQFRLQALVRLRSANPSLTDPELIRLLVRERYRLTLPPAAG